MTRATAASPARSPRPRSPAGTGAVVDLDPLVELRGASGETTLFGEGPGGFVVAGSRGAIEALAADAGGSRRDPGRRGRRRPIEISAAEASLSIALADAERAWRSLADRLAAAPA